MIIVDDFIADPALLEGVRASAEFRTPRRWGWWDGWWKSPARCLPERVVQYALGPRCPLAARLDWPASVAGFEYWTLAHQSQMREPAVELGPTSHGRDRVLPHRDRDERHFQRTGESKFPRMGFVFYPVQHSVEGGFLKIYFCDTQDGPFELIEPLHNRLVVFDASLLHEVTPVTAGRRYSFAFNAWDYRIQNQVDVPLETRTSTTASI